MSQEVRKSKNEGGLGVKEIELQNTLMLLVVSNLSALLPWFCRSDLSLYAGNFDAGTWIKSRL